MKIMKIKDFINILLILIITGFAVGITYVQLLYITKPWGTLYILWFILVILLGNKLKNDY